MTRRVCMAKKEKNFRAGHKEGSIYYVGARDRWVAEITLETGKRKKAYCKTKQEAQRKKNEMLRELERGMLATGPQRKLGEYRSEERRVGKECRARRATYQ